MTSVRPALLVAAVLVLAPTAALAAPQRFVVSPSASRVEFVSGTQMGEFRGGTSALSGEILYDPETPAAVRLALAVDAARLASDNAVRDAHMRDKLLEVSRFPTVTLAVTAFRPAGEAAGTLEGTLTLHGVSRPVAMPIRFVRDGAALRGEARFALALTDYGMTPPRLLGLKVRDAVTVEVRLVAERT